MNIRIFIVSVAAAISISLPVAAHAQTDGASTRW
jgi:hypothetical protein